MEAFGYGACGHLQEDSSGTPARPYPIKETLFQDGRKTLYRAVRKADGLPVILKVLGKQHRPKDAERLRHEYEIGRSLDRRTTAAPLAVESHEGMPALVIEDFGGDDSAAAELNHGFQSASAVKPEGSCHMTLARPRAMTPWWPPTRENPLPPPPDQ